MAEPSSSLAQDAGPIADAIVARDQLNIDQGAAAPATGATPPPLDMTIALAGHAHADPIARQHQAVAAADSTHTIALACSAVFTCSGHHSPPLAAVVLAPLRHDLVWQEPGQHFGRRSGCHAPVNEPQHHVEHVPRTVP